MSAEEGDYCSSSSISISIKPLGFDEWCSIPVLGNSNVVVIAAVFTELCMVPAAVLLQHVPRCSDRTCHLVRCSGPHQLCP